jgi:hypothetical protein
MKFLEVLCVVMVTHDSVEYCEMLEHYYGNKQHVYLSL